MYRIGFEKKIVAYPLIYIEKVISRYSIKGYGSFFLSLLNYSRILMDNKLHRVLWTYVQVEELMELVLGERRAGIG